MDDNSTQAIKFTVKELLTEIRADIRGLDKKLDGKADSKDVVSLALRVSELERNHAASQGVSDFRRWMIPIIIFATLGAPGWLLALTQYFAGK